MTSLMQDSRLNALRAQIPILANATNITALGGGLTNLNYRVDTTTASYVMRVGTTASGLLAINRENEGVNTKRAHKAGVGPALVDLLLRENVLVISWIEARTLHNADFKSQPELIPRIANSLRMLHAGPKFMGDFHFPAIRRKYLKTVLDAGYFIPDQYLIVEPLVLELEKAIASNPEELVPCNNDFIWVS